MQRCPNCKWQIPDDAASCSYCGQSLHPDADADEERRRRMLRLHMFNAMRRKSRPSLPALIGALLAKPVTVAMAVLVVGGAAAGIGYARWATAPREPSFDLSGRWFDSAREITISYTGEDTVRAEFVQEYECDPRDGTPIQKTKLDFEAKITGNQLEGQTTGCEFSLGAPARGLILVQMKLTISTDGQTLQGLPPDAGYFDYIKNQWLPLTITRKRPSGLKDWHLTRMATSTQP
jgi:zinc ribbon protein